MSERSKLWILAAGGLVFAQGCASLLIAPGFALNVFSDVTQCVLLLSGTAALLPNIRKNHGRARLFWSLMTLGIFFWLTYQLLWTYIEVVLRQEVPQPFVGDIVIFLHIVPMMAALALQRQAQQNEHEARLGHLDFVLLLTWWVYLYLFAVIPWQYAQRDEFAYGRSLNALYLTEKLVFLVALAVIGCAVKRDGARYTRTGLVRVCFTLSALTSRIGRSCAISTFTGSLYDLPLAASMGWVSVVGVIGQDLHPQEEKTQASGRHGVWVARLGMMVILSLPVLAAWSVFNSSAPDRVRNFRLVLTLVTMMIMGGIVFLRQHLLDRELIRLLRSSEESFNDLKRLQTQLIQSEKLASLGQLVGGAAHELNNPLTAMLGYSELLASSGLTEEQRTLASKIAHQVRRTRVLIASLLNFARQAPGEKTLVDINAVVQTALKHNQPQFSSRRVEVQLSLADDLKQISGDPNQLLQVFLHIASNAQQALEEVGGGIFSVKTRQKDDTVILELSDNGPGARDPERVFDPFYTTRSVGKGAGLGLSACYGIIQDHHGRILCTNRVEGGMTIHIELPVAGTPPLVAPADVAATLPGPPEGTPAPPPLVN